MGKAFWQVSTEHSQTQLRRMLADRTDAAIVLNEA